MVVFAGKHKKEPKNMFYASLVFAGTHEHLELETVIKNGLFYYE